MVVAILVNIVCMATTVFSSVTLGGNFNSNPAYDISAPSEITPDSVINICFEVKSVTNFDGILIVTLKIVSTNEILSTEVIHEFDGTEKCFNMTVPDTYHNQATLFADGHFDEGFYLIENSGVIAIKQEASIVFIGDQSVYTPGQTIQFDITRKTKTSIVSMNDRIESVWIEDSHRTRVNDARFVSSGIITTRPGINLPPTLQNGEYTINVKDKTDNVFKKTFLVNIDISVTFVIIPQVIHTHVKELTWKICAFHQKPVTGSLALTISRTSNINNRLKEVVIYKRPLIMLNGCHSVNINRRELLLDNEMLNHFNVLNFSANVIEKQSGMKASAQRSIEIQTRSTSKYHSFFTAGRSYTCKITVNSDNRTTTSDAFHLEIEDGSRIDGDTMNSDEKKKPLLFDINLSDRDVEALTCSNLPETTSNGNTVLLKEVTQQIDNKINILENKLINQMSQMNQSVQPSLTTNDDCNCNTQLSKVNIQIDSLWKFKDGTDSQINSMKGKMDTTINLIDVNRDNLHNIQKNYEFINEKLQKEFNDAKKEYESKISKFDSRTTSLEKQMAEMKTQKPDRQLCSWSEKSGPFTWEDSSRLRLYRSYVHTLNVPDIHNRAHQTSSEYESEIFPLPDYRLGAKVKLELRADTYAYISICFVDYYNTGKPLNFKVTPKISYILRDRGGTHWQDRVRLSDFLFGDAPVFNKYYLATLICPKLQLVHWPLNIHNTVVFDVFVEPPSMALRSYSHSGVEVLEIEKYVEKKRLAEQEFEFVQISPYFYTSVNGYRVQVGMWLNGANAFKGKGLVVKVQFLTGEFDVNLTKSFAHKTTITIFHQKDPAKNIVVCVEKDLQNGREYFVDILNPDIRNGEAVLDNVLLYKINVTAVSVE